MLVGDRPVLREPSAGAGPGLYWIKYRGTHFPVHEKECLVGRGRHCSIVLSSPHARREHALIRPLGEGLELTNLAGRSDLLVNGAAVQGRRSLSLGDCIDLAGEQLLVTKKVESDRPPAPPAVAQRQALELAEDLLLRGAESGHRQHSGRAIFSIVDTLIENANPATCQLSVGETVRLTAVAQVAARWMSEAPFATGSPTRRSLDEWSERVERTLRLAPACLAHQP